MARVTPSEFISGKLRQNLTDVNANRTAANWIYPDKPKLMEISKNVNNFPRIAVTELKPAHSLNEIGIGGTETEDEVSIAINVYAVKEHLLPVASDDEEFLYGGETDVELAIEPINDATVVGIKDSQSYPFIKGQDYILLDNNGDGRYDGIKWTGTGDVPDNATNYTVTGIRRLSGEDLTKYLAHSVHMYLRDNWREDIAPTLYGYMRLDVNPVAELEGTISRTELRIKFNGVNIGD